MHCGFLYFFGQFRFVASALIYGKHEKKTSLINVNHLKDFRELPLLNGLYFCSFRLELALLFEGRAR